MRSFILGWFSDIVDFFKKGTSGSVTSGQSSGQSSGSSSNGILGVVDSINEAFQEVEDAINAMAQHLNELDRTVFSTHDRVLEIEKALIIFIIGAVIAFIIIWCYCGNLRRSSKALTEEIRRLHERLDSMPGSKSDSKETPWDSKNYSVLRDSSETSEPPAHENHSNSTNWALIIGTGVVVIIVISMVIAGSR